MLNEPVPTHTIVPIAGAVPNQARTGRRIKSRWILGAAAAAAAVSMLGVASASAPLGATGDPIHLTIGRR